MGRKHKNGWRCKALPVNFSEIIQTANEKKIKKACLYCAYCGREIKPGSWHWVMDEFGQKVRKCNDTQRCWRYCKPEAKEAYKAALLRKTANCRLIRWLEKEQ